MNVSTSECSSGCESGWTMYFDQYSNSNDPCFVNNYQKEGAYLSEDQEEDEDLSMVSDASSGPPPHDYDNSQYHYNGYENTVSESNKKNKQKNKNKEPKLITKKQQSLCLDDTASSPVYNFSQGNDTNHAMENVPGFSQAYSASHFESESGTRKHLGFFKSSTKGKSGSLLGRKRQ